MTGRSILMLKDSWLKGMCVCVCLYSRACMSGLVIHSINGRVCVCVCVCCVLCVVCVCVVCAGSMGAVIKTVSL